MAVGIEKFWIDTIANLHGNFNSLMLVPLMLAMSCFFALELMGRRSYIRTCLQWMCSSSQLHDAESQARLRMHSDKLDLSADSAVCRFSTFLAFFAPAKFDTMKKAALMQKFKQVGLVSALLLGSSISMFSFELGPVTELDKNVHGILWCIAVYTFQFSTLLSVMYTFAYGQCGTDFEVRHFSRTMGTVALRLPIFFAGFGFFDFIAATTHFYIMNFRGGLAHDFSICAAFCYSAIPMALIAILKTHHSLGVTRRWHEKVESLAPLQYSDIDNLFRDYLQAGKDHLDVDFTDFLNFVTERKLVVNGEERGGRLRGLRRAYAESLVKSFQELERSFQKERSDEAARIIFDELTNRVSFTTALGVFKARENVMEHLDFGDEARTMDAEQEPRVKWCVHGQARSDTSIDSSLGVLKI